MRWKVTPILLLFLIFLTSNAFAQFKLYESTFNGGVVTGGYSNGATVPSGSGSFNVTIPPGSTIRQAYLIAGRVGNAPNLTVTLNGTPFTFNAGNIVTTGFNTLYGGNSAVHAIDVTASISAATSAYTIAVPVQSNTVSDKFPEFYLYIAFNNAGLPAINSAIYLNTVTLQVSSFSWTLNTTQAVNNSQPVGFAILGGYATTGSDCEQVVVNGTNIGSFGGQDFNASSQWGCMGAFQYYNNVLTGYNDDNANQAILLTDALSNIQGVIPGSTNSIPVTFNHCGGGSDNHVWAVFLTWGGVILDGNLLNFEAQPLDNSVQLAWATSSEEGVSHFELQHSLNGNDFNTVGNVAAKGTENGESYTWPHADPREGSNWYRVRMVGADGVASFSEIREVQFGGAHALAIGLSPNPVRRGGELQLQLVTGNALNWTIYGMGDGRELLKGQHTNGMAATLPTNQLAAGVYGLKLEGDGKVQMMKFVVE